MRLYRTGASINSGRQSFKCYAREESSVVNAGWRWNNDSNKARVHFNNVGKGSERFSDYVITIDYADLLNALPHIIDPKAKLLYEYAYINCHLPPRYPMPSKISHWCNVLMTEVRKTGVI